MLEFFRRMFGLRATPEISLNQLRPGFSNGDRPAVVMVQEGAVGLHCGVAYLRPDGTERLIHLAFHHLLTDEALLGSDPRAFISPTVDPIDLEVVAQMCDLGAGLAEEGVQMAYGFRYDESRLQSSGHPEMGPREVGFTCTTYVMALFAYARVELVDRPTWSRRSRDRVAEDTEAQRRLVEMLRPRASPEHVAAVAKEVGCMRFRAEEIAAASASPRPLSFRRAAVAGASLADRFRERFSGAPTDS